MPEETMVALVQRALEAKRIHDEVVAVGEVNPRGHTGGLFSGGLAGSEVGGLLGGAGESVGMGAGSLAGMHAADAESGLPEKTLGGVSASAVYGLAARTDYFVTGTQTFVYDPKKDVIASYELHGQAIDSCEVPRLDRQQPE